MLDPQLIRTRLNHVATALSRRGMTLDTETLERLEGARKRVQTETESLQAERNRSSKAIGQAKASGEDIEPLKAEVSKLGDQLKDLQSELESVQDELNTFLLGLPNLPHGSVPDGDSEDHNDEQRRQSRWRNRDCLQGCSDDGGPTC